MEQHNIRHLPIVEDRKVTGLISLWEIYKTRLQNMEVENRQLTHMLHGRDKTGDYEL
jgi:signal-transduction protein with cAMP-binding, CBS, and nucleotidyltransferase domain